MVALEAQEFDKVCEAIHETCPEARVTSWSGNINARGHQTHRVTFVVAKAVDPIWVESTFGKMFAKGLINISTNGGTQSAPWLGGQVSFQATMPTSTVTVEIKHIGFALYEMNQKLAWKRASAEFTVLMDDLLKK